MSNSFLILSAMRLPKTLLTFSSILLSFVSFALCSLKFAKFSRGNPPSVGLTFRYLPLSRLLTPQVLAALEDLDSNLCVYSPVNLSSFSLVYLLVKTFCLDSQSVPLLRPRIIKCPKGKNSLKIICLPL